MRALVSALGWRVGRPGVRRRLRAALAAHAGGRMLPVQEVVCAAGLEAIPSGQIQAALTDLVNAGLAEGLRGPGGWLHVRSSTPAFAGEPRFSRSATGAAGEQDVRRKRTTVPAGQGSEQHASRSHGHESAAGSEGAASATAPQAVPEEADGPGGWSLAPAAALAAPGALRSFSVTTRLPVRRTGDLTKGMALFVVAVLAAAAAALFLMRNGATKGHSAPATRAEWYREVAQSYVRAHRAGRPGFAWPYRFAEVGGVRENASRAELERGMERYLAVALFTGYPSQVGILAWARREFGEMPSGQAGDEWMRRVAESYAARALKGVAGYELTPALLAAGGITAEERDPTAVADGLVRALRAALYLGTPEPGGVLDWARRTVGEPPKE